ncbi:NAD(P)/FAD-dependent oxidoreductase [Rhodanobacter sp. C03]|uniref:NAD(P)/FAD-dependent oxidoreductase n=1 Tax=Rhodanobacter sp. C03 TaxID=1945858 RepID=UPI0020C1CA18|nr:NAD(P)/FAD-dependent oxidoreductase [Rhodanobacter sp. C03]
MSLAARIGWSETTCCQRYMASLPYRVVVPEINPLVWHSVTGRERLKLIDIKNRRVVVAQTSTHVMNSQEVCISVCERSICTDAVIVGAGPVGLFQVFELGLLGVSAHIIDSMPQVGGQCIELYPDKPIYDIPAVPVCSARELIERLQAQIRPFAPQFHLGETLTTVDRLESGRFKVTTSAGTTFNTGALIIAGGLGAFAPRKLALPDIEGVEGHAVHYKVIDASKFDGKDIVIAGGGDAALDWSLALVDRANSIVLVHRSTKFRAAPAHVKRMQELCDAGRMQFFEGDIVGLDAPEGELKWVRVRARSGVVQRIESEQLLVFWGLHPALGPIAEWGLQLDHQQIVVDTATFQTSKGGIYAVGDVSTYPGKKKLILSGFHEAALCAFAVKEHLNPGEKVHLQYTTTSPIMHKRLGVVVGADGAPIVPAASPASAGLTTDVASNT